MEFSTFQAQFTPQVKLALARQAKLAEHAQLQGAICQLLGRGKLFRPLLVLATTHAISSTPLEPVVGMASSIELIHTFTLIHDDLPCMDDAELRRGVAAVHRAYPEALAVLAGDALVNLAYHVLATEDAPIDASTRLRLVAAAGTATHAVVEGQVLDLEAEGRALGLPELRRMHRLKTGALIAACCEFGAIMSGWDDSATAKLHSIGMGIGLAFQIRDDLLSFTSSEAEMGKTLRTDADMRKATYARLIGLEASETELESILESIEQQITSLDLPAPGLLIEIARLAGTRRH